MKEEEEEAREEENPIESSKLSVANLFFSFLSSVNIVAM